MSVSHYLLLIVESFSAGAFIFGIGVWLLLRVRASSWALRELDVLIFRYEKRTERNLLAKPQPDQQQGPVFDRGVAQIMVTASASEVEQGPDGTIRLRRHPEDCICGGTGACPADRLRKLHTGDDVVAEVNR